MKIGIIGSGTVGQVLGTALLKEGHEVMLGTRDLSKPEVIAWRVNNPTGSVGLFTETTAFGELIILAVKGLKAIEALEQSDMSQLAGKILIDTTNPIDASAPVNGVLPYFTTYNESLMERIQGRIPNTKVVKAFNNVGSMYMYKPKFPGGTPTMFICGDDAGAKATVTSILTSFGWETEDMGMSTSARAIEPLCILWCLPGFLNNRWGHAFKLLKA